MTKREALEKQFERALKKFDEILQEKKTEIARDAAILRFEFTFDVAWKALKEYLENRKNVMVASPGDCFREAYRTGVIEYKATWLKMAKARNEAVHTYKEALAKALYKKLPGYLKMFKELAESLKK